MNINVYKAGLACLAVIGTMTSLYILTRLGAGMGMDMSDVYLDSKSNEYTHQQPGIEVPRDTSSLDSNINDKRIRHLKDVCKNRELFDSRVYRGKTRPIFYVSDDYNFSYCKVMKSGSTMWIQIFLMLRNISSEEISRLPRVQIHTKSKLSRIPFVQPVSRQTRMVIVTRDPYSRLHSAFIDKVYLGLLFDLRARIRGNTATCNLDISFDEFLRYIIDETRSNKSLNRHWAPVFSQCTPCDVNVWRLVKQETFTTDVENVLKDLDIEADKYEMITDALHDHRIEATVPGIIVEAYTRFRGDIVKCLGASGAAQRLWISFQIQGYIDETIEFPQKQFSDEFKHDDYTALTNLILETIKANPLTSLESKQQRYRALVTAYQTVSDETIEGIQDVYKQDFALYGYDTRPPVMNDEGLPRGYDFY